MGPGNLAVSTIKNLPVKAGSSFDGLYGTILRL
jgi:hypothetical protein